MFAAYSMWYLIRDAVVIWKLSKSKEKEWNKFVNSVRKQTRKEANEKQD